MPRGTINQWHCRGVRTTLGDPHGGVTPPEEGGKVALCTCPEALLSVASQGGGRTPPWGVTQPAEGVVVLSAHAPLHSQSVASEGVRATVDDIYRRGDTNSSMVGGGATLCTCLEVITFSG